MLLYLASYRMSFRISICNEIKFFCYWNCNTTLFFLDLHFLTSWLLWKKRKILSNLSRFKRNSILLFKVEDWMCKAFFHRVTFANEQNWYKFLQYVLIILLITVDCCISKIPLVQYIQHHIILQFHSVYRDMICITTALRLLSYGIYTKIILCM